MKTILTLTFLAMLPLSAKEKEEVLQLSPAKTEIHFTVGSTLHTVHGTFQLKRGSIRFDPMTGHAEGEMVVDAASGSSGSDARDSRMAKVVLEAEKYPDITFKAEQIQGAWNQNGDSRIVLKGMFGLHGEKHEIEAPVEAKVTGSEIDAVMHFPVLYVKWGLKDPSNFLLKVDKQVQIEVHVKGALMPAN